jgi:Ca2+-binding EF-hand superfamily protein
MNELFSKYKDNSELETIHVRRLLEALQAFGKNPSQKDCQHRIIQLQSDQLTFEDFKQLINEPWVSTNNDRNSLRKALQEFDQSKEGFIDIEQFRIAMRTLGEPLSDKEVDGLIQLGLNDGYQKIEIECKFLSKINLLNYCQFVFFLDLLDQLLGNNV